MKNKKTEAEFEYLNPVNQDAMDFLKDNPDLELSPDEEGEVELPESMELT